MFRKISYLTMVTSVLISWGMLLNLAQKADFANGTTNMPGLGATAAQAAKSSLAKSNPVETALAGTARPALRKEARVVLKLAPAKTVKRRAPAATSTAAVDNSIK